MPRPRPTRTVVGLGTGALAAAALGAGAAAPAQAKNATLQIPFKCGVTVNAQVRSNHSPPNSVDFNGTGGGSTDLGMTVVASGSGRVVHAGMLPSSDGRGISVAIRHRGGVVTAYSHMRRASVKEGQRVARGQKVGEIGHSGNGDAADAGTPVHLHYEQANATTWPGVSPRRAAFGGRVPAAWYAPATINDTHAVKSRNCGNATPTPQPQPQPSTGGGTGVRLPKGYGARRAATVRTDNGLAVSARLKPTTASKLVRRLSGGDRVRIVCQARGRKVTGKYGTSRLWDLVDLGGGRGAYVTDTYVYTGSDGRVARSCPR